MWQVQKEHRRKRKKSYFSIFNNTFFCFFNKGSHKWCTTFCCQERWFIFFSDPKLWRTVGTECRWLSPGLVDKVIQRATQTRQSQCPKNHTEYRASTGITVYAMNAHLSLLRRSTNYPFLLLFSLEVRVAASFNWIPVMWHLSID